MTYSLRLVLPPPREPKAPAVTYPDAEERIYLVPDRVCPVPDKICPRGDEPFRYPESPERLCLTSGGRFLPRGIASLSPAALRAFRKILKTRDGAASKS